MNTVTHIMELDLYTTTSYPVIKAQQFDNETRILRVLLKDHEETYVLTQGVSVNLIGDRPEDGKPEGRGFLINGQIESYNPAIVSFDITQAITRAGIAVAKVKISELSESEESEEDLETNSLTSIPLYIDISEEVASEASMTVEEKSIVQQLVDEVATVAGAVNTHINDTVVHINQQEHERLNALRNIVYSQTEPSSQEEGDSWLQQYT